MDVLHTYNATTTIATFMVNATRNANDDTLKELKIDFGTTRVQVPDYGITTLRIASCAVDLNEYNRVGTVRIDIDRMPVMGSVVAQTTTGTAGVNMGYIMVEFNDRAPQIDPTAQPVVQLHPGTHLSDFTVKLEFVPIVTDQDPSLIQSLNMLLVMETDGTRQGNTSMFQN